MSWLDRDEIATIQIQKRFNKRAVPCGISRFNFGRNPDIDTGGSEQVWNYGGIEVLPTTNAIDTISSSSASDTGHRIYIEGIAENSKGEWVDVKQTVALNGQNKVTLDQPLIRVLSAYDIDGDSHAGDVYIYEDDTITAGVPQTAANVHLLIRTEDQASGKSVMSTPSNRFFVVHQIIATVSRKTKANVDFLLQIRTQGNVWRTVFQMNVTAEQGTNKVEATIPFIVPPKSDLRILASTDTNNTEVTSDISGTCFLVIDGLGDPTLP